MSSRTIIFGLGQGLGLEVWRQTPDSEFLIFQRKDPLKIETEATDKTKQPFKTSWEKLDLSKPTEVEYALKRIELFAPDRLWFFAGGGPFGGFWRGRWGAHQWAIDVSFFSQLRILHDLDPEKRLQIIFVSSLVADQQDMLAASYSAAKAALSASIRSVQAEVKGDPAKNIDIRLFRPSYFTNGILPQGSPPHRLGLTLDPKDVAGKFVKWALNSRFVNTNFALS